MMTALRRCNGQHPWPCAVLLGLGGSILSIAAVYLLTGHAGLLGIFLRHCAGGM